MRWLRDSLFPDPVTSVVTVVLVILLWKIIPPFIDWAFIDAVWRPDARACHDASGACWGFIAEKHRFILFGTYPFEQHWRPAGLTRFWWTPFLLRPDAGHRGAGWRASAPG